MGEQGWYRDPYAVHDDRWFSDGEPTRLVRDNWVESYDEPPSHRPVGVLVPAPPPAPRRAPPPAAKSRRIWPWVWLALPFALMLLVTVWAALAPAMGAAKSHCYCYPGHGQPGAQALVAGVLCVVTLALLLIGVLQPVYLRVATAISWTVGGLALLVTVGASLAR